MSRVYGTGERPGFDDGAGGGGTGGGTGGTTVLELAFRGAAGEGMQPLPAGVTEMHGQLYPQVSAQGTTYGDAGGDNGGYVTGGSGLNGVDARGDGTWNANYHGRAIRVDQAAGTFTVHCALGLNFAYGNVSRMEIWSGGNYPGDAANGSVLVATCNAPATVFTAGNVVDAVGTSRAVGTFFANEQPIAFTTTHDHFWLTSVDGYGIDWVKITK